MKNVKVPFFNYQALFRADEPALTAIFKDVCERGAYIAQRELSDFEEALARFCGVRFAVGVADGTDAIIIALKAAGIGPGDEVIVASHTMVATAAAVAFVGATPVLVDCGRDHMMDISSARAAITTRTKALLPTQLNGRCCNMEALGALASEHGLIILEDAAQALGAKFKGRDAGTFGVAGTISFYPAKTLGCFGDGGAIFCNDESVHRTIKLLRDHGRDERGEVVCWGLNSRLDNLQAAILLHKLKSYPQAIQRRREIAAMYQRLLGDLEQVQLPPGPDSDERYFDIYQNYEIEAEQRDQLRTFLSENGIGTLVQWGGKAVHQWSGLGFKISLPYTERMFQR
ncbi:MAG: DegT/DnrJ/EryC1/StrS family aminotransferase, partial [Deltaproteobacteria bacterium]|nr:DegT/DnrJ/EryC1/StrS family aminotransferase [Deltaproteobacteria bacterium]